MVWEKLKEPFVQMPMNGRLAQHTTLTWTRQIQLQVAKPIMALIGKVAKARFHAFLDSTTG
jgi:hypothetical protein